MTPNHSSRIKERLRYKANTLSRISRVILLSIASRVKEITAMASGYGFYCKSLAGESRFSPAVNADLSVSCNCADSDGSGVLGNLSESGLQEIWKGPIANKFRHKLASGKIPILRCVTCQDLAITPKSQASLMEHVDKVPASTVLLENTAACTLNCIACRRTSRPLKKMHMSLSEMEFVLIELSKLEVKTIEFFNLGEPFLSRHILDEVNLVRQYLPEVELHTSTIGMFLSQEKIEAAFKFNLMFFSLDGPDGKTATRYQIGLNFDQAITNLRQLVVERDRLGHKMPYIVWRYVIFNWNDRQEQIERAIEMAKHIGVDAIEFRWAMSPPWGISFRFYVSKFWKELAPIQGHSRNLRFKTTTYRW